MNATTLYSRSRFRTKPKWFWQSYLPSSYINVPFRQHFKIFFLSWLHRKLSEHITAFSKARLQAFDGQAGVPGKNHWPWMDGHYPLHMQALKKASSQAFSGHMRWRRPEHWPWMGGHYPFHMQALGINSQPMVVTSKILLHALSRSQSDLSLWCPCMPCI